MTEFVQVVPQQGREKEMFQLLLQLADSPRDVKVNTDGPGVTAMVPAELAYKYQQTGEEKVTGMKRRGRPPGRKSTRPTAAPISEPEADTEGES